MNQPKHNDMQHQEGNENSGALKIVQQQDKIGPKEVYDKYFSSYHAMVIKWMANQQAAEDILSNVFEKICRKDKTFPSYEDALRYLSKSVHNEFKDTCKNLKRQKLLLQLPEVMEINPEDITVTAELYRLVHALVEELSPRRRSVLKLHLAGLNTKEIALELNMTEQNVRNIRNEGKDTLLIKLLEHGISLLLIAQLL